MGGVAVLVDDNPFHSPFDSTWILVESRNSAGLDSESAGILGIPPECTQNRAGMIRNMTGYVILVFSGSSWHIQSTIIFKNNLKSPKNWIKNNNIRSNTINSGSYHV